MSKILQNLQKMRPGAIEIIAGHQVLRYSDVPQYFALYDGSKVMTATEMTDFLERTPDESIST